MKLWNTMRDVAILVLLMSIAGGTTLDRLGKSWTLMLVAQIVVVGVWVLVRHRDRDR